jgi:hypothetical protein
VVVTPIDTTGDAIRCNTEQGRAKKPPSKYAAFANASVMLLGAEINAAIWQSVADVAEKTGKPASEDEATETHRTGMNLQGGEDGR